MVQATRWRQDRTLLPTSPYQRIRYAPTFPSGGGADSAFAWSPVPLGDDFTWVGSPDGVIPGGGLSGALRGFGSSLGLSLDTGGLLRGVAALGGIALGAWLAKRNMGR
jgi:hypothetical protein